VKAQVTSSGGQIAPTNRAVVRESSKPAPGPESTPEPSDVFRSEALLEAPTKDDKVASPERRSEASQPAIASPSSARSTNSGSPAVLTQLDETPVPEQPPGEKGLTLAELARSATQGIRNLVLGDQLKPFRAELEAINQAADQAAELKTPQQFAAKTAEFKARLAQGEPLDSMRVEAYAVAREAAKQATGMFAFDCQVLGALAMDDGHISEMRTGEGKTLTAVLPLYLNALAGQGAHLITVNETLARRDAEWMGPIFEKLGMSVGCVTEDQGPTEKKAGYNCDVTYVSDRALGFDFLRDRGALDPAERVQRGMFFALIDEVDEVAIDEARTPMIMSGKAGVASPDYEVFRTIVKDLVPGEDFNIDEESRSAWLTDGGLRLVENEVTLLEARQALSTAAPRSEEALQAQQTLEKGQLLRGAIRRENTAQKTFDDLEYEKPNPFARAVGLNGKYDRQAARSAESALKVATQIRENLSNDVPTVDLYSEENLPRIHYLEASLKAHTLFVRGKDYTVEDDEVKIVDTNKGRVSDGKRYSNGLHQALEAKEGLPVGAETKTISKITMPELIAQYERKAGMTGTGKTSEAEFLKLYGLDVIEIPTNKPVIRTDHPDLVFANKETKFQAVVEEAMKAASEGRPILVGTVSVNSNREVAARLLKAGWPPDKLQILNAERVKGGEDFHDSNAGRSGTITLTTGERGDSVQPDPVNYKKMAFLAFSALAEGKPVLIDTDRPEDAEQVRAWLESAGPVMTDRVDPEARGVQIRVRKNREQPAPEGLLHIDAAEHTVGKAHRFKLEENDLADLVPRVLELFAEGEPVILEAAGSKGLSEAAEQLLDRGLGLEALPMVCEGKEKENAMIELAGRSGVITVATNMAGRGANIKPDLIAIERLAEAAFEPASNGQPVTVSVQKESQATKIQRLLEDHIETVIARTPEQQAKPGQVLLRVEKQPLKPTEGEFLDGADFATGGLYVIGTERAASRRIDDQLIGRAGRQGAPGDSKFFLSLEDDVPRIFGSERFESLLGLFGDAGQGISSDTVNHLMDKAQERVENQHFEQRENSHKYDAVNRIQRETFYKMRESVLTGQEDPVEFVADFSTRGFANLVRERLGAKGKYQASEVREAVRELAHDHKIPVSLPTSASGKLKSDELEEILFPQIQSLLSNPNLSPEKLRRATLGQLDGAWQEHLENMDQLRDGIHFESMTGRKPEEVFVERGYQVFEGMMEQLQESLALKLLPAAGRLNS